MFFHLPEVAMSNALFHLDILVLVFAVSGAVLQPFQSINNQISSTNGSSSLIPIATTNRAETIVQLSNATASAPVNLGALRAQCNARKFGSNLNVPSCRNAFAHIFPNDTNFSFGMRHDGRQYDTKLPFQWLSGRYYSSALSYPPPLCTQFLIVIKRW